MSYRPRTHLLSAIVISALTLGARGAGEVPWPFGAPPSASHVRALVSDALALAARTRHEEVNGAKTRGEELENAQIDQARVDAGKLDNKTIFLFGDEFFDQHFRRDGGLGGLIQGPSPKRVHRGKAGGLDTFSCAGCHSVGGNDGAGGPTQSALTDGDGDRASTALVRNPPALLGVGMIQELGVEMSADLAAVRAGAIAAAKDQRKAITVDLVTKGTRFGSLTARPDGTLDTSAVRGIDADLVVRPFGWKGDTARLRRMVEEAARIHFGIQSHVLALKSRDVPDPERLGHGQNWWDPDDDGVDRELEEGSISATAAYLTMLEVPVIVPPHDPGLLDHWASGDRLFDAIGCAGCHTRALKINRVIWEEKSDTTNGPPIRVNLLVDGDAPRGGDQVMLFSDLERHDLGSDLADPAGSPSGIPRGEFLTRPLWGVAESPPYLHDGRAATLPEAIFAHGGEARGARDAFAALSPGEQADLHVFLLSLSREPKVRVAR